MHTEKPHKHINQIIWSKRHTKLDGTRRMPKTTISIVGVAKCDSDSYTQTGNQLRERDRMRQPHSEALPYRTNRIIAF